jgi:uncharacterized repeat protein (TIGR04076 family)
MTEMKLYDIRVTVERIEGRSVCGLQVGDYFEVTESSRVRIPEGRHFCLYAMQSVLPLIPAKQRQLPAEDWLEQDSLVCCPDPEERVVMRIERLAERSLKTEELTWGRSVSGCCRTRGPRSTSRSRSGPRRPASM